MESNNPPNMEVRASLEPGRCQQDVTQAPGLRHEGRTCAVLLHMAATCGPRRHRNPVRLKPFPTIRECKYAHDTHKQT